MRRLIRLVRPQAVSGVWLLIALIACFSILSPATFPTTFTLRTVGTDQAVTTIVALALLIPLVAGAFDLSIGNTLGLSVVVSAHLMAVEHLSIPVALLATAAMGAAIGVVNGLLVAVVRIDSFIATLGTSSVIQGLITLVSGNQYIIGLPRAFTRIATANPLGIPVVIWVLVLAVLVTWYVLENTPLGRYLYAVGGNREAARLAGVRTQILIFSALVVAALGATLAGILVTAQLNAGSPQIGPSYLLPTFAAVFLGATQFKVGRVNVLGTVLAVYLLATGVRGLLLLGAPTYVSDFFDGAALIVAVAITVWAGSLARADPSDRRRLRFLWSRGRTESEPFADKATDLR